MDTKIVKQPHELLVGDIFVYVANGKRCHFKVKSISDTTRNSDYTCVEGELLWVGGDGKYYDSEVGFVENFSFTRKLDWRLEILKTSRHGCCEVCGGHLEWVSLALKCSECGKILI